MAQDRDDPVVEGSTTANDIELQHKDCSEADEVATATEEGESQTEAKPHIGAAPSATRMLLVWLTPYLRAVRATATESVGALVAVYVLGFLVGGRHFAAAGVPIGDLPVLRLFGAGVLFALSTVVFMLVGTALARTRKGFFAKLLMIVVAFFAFSTVLEVAPPGPFALYMWTVVSVGYWWTRNTLNQDLPRFVYTLRDSIVGVVQPFLWMLVLAGMFAGGVYRTISPGMGGGRLREIHVRWSKRPTMLGADDRLFEVAQLNDVLYLGVQKGHGGGSFVRRWLRPVPLGPRYIAVAREAATEIEYLQERGVWSVDEREPSSRPVPSSRVPEGGEQVAARLGDESLHPCRKPLP